MIRADIRLKIVFTLIFSIIVFSLITVSVALNDKSDEQCCDIDSRTHENIFTKTDVKTTDVLKRLTKMRICTRFEGGRYKDAFEILKEALGDNLLWDFAQITCRKTGVDKTIFCFLSSYADNEAIVYVTTELKKIDNSTQNSKVIELLNIYDNNEKTVLDFVYYLKSDDVDVDDIIELIEKNGGKRSEDLEKPLNDEEIKKTFQLLKEKKHTDAYKVIKEKCGCMISTIFNNIYAKFDEETFTVFEYLLKLNESAGLKYFTDELSKENKFKLPLLLNNVGDDKKTLLDKAISAQKIGLEVEEFIKILKSFNAKTASEVKEIISQESKLLKDLVEKYQSYQKSKTDENKDKFIKSAESYLKRLDDYMSCLGYMYDTRVVLSWYFKTLEESEQWNKIVEKADELLKMKLLVAPYKNVLSVSKETAEKHLKQDKE